MPVDALAYSHEAASMLDSQSAPVSDEVRYSYFRALLAADRHEEAASQLNLAIQAFEARAARQRFALLGEFARDSDANSYGYATTIPSALR